VVPQETFLFSETIRENLCLARPPATEEMLGGRGGRAHSQEFEEFPQGFETMVGSAA
jgi:ABC-type multidrug transport system fused ATPase/permease subunit